MIDFEIVEDYLIFGKGKSLPDGFYMLDEELFEIFSMYLPEKFRPYSLIYNRIDQVNYKYEFHEIQLEKFLLIRKEGIVDFYIKSDVVSREISLRGLNIKNDLKQVVNDFNKTVRYLIYNGLIKISLGWPWPNRKFEQSYISFVDRFAKIEEPSLVFFNKEYSEIYSSLLKGIKKILKYQSKRKLLDGKDFISRNKNISEGFAQSIRSGTLIADIEIHE